MQRDKDNKTRNVHINKTILKEKSDNLNFYIKLQNFFLFLQKTGKKTVLIESCFTGL